jgi:hypothetical protein
MTDELRKLAEALTDPKWERGHPLPSKDTADRFRAAASPAAIIALLDERDEARAAVKRLAGALETTGHSKHCYLSLVGFDAPGDACDCYRTTLYDPVVRRIVEE